MCIRDRTYIERSDEPQIDTQEASNDSPQNAQASWWYYCVCLLYTSDAADERSSVDLGGRRIIKKKKTVECDCDIIREIQSNRMNANNEQLTTEWLNNHK